MTHKEIATEARNIAEMAHDAHGENGCPVEIAVDSAAQVTWESYDGDDIAADEERGHIIALGKLPYFRLVYGRRYAQLGKGHGPKCPCADCQIGNFA